MFTRISSACAAALLVSACGQSDGGEANGSGGSETAHGIDGSIISCAVNGNSEFSDDCQAERLVADHGITLIVRHPDGGFRRFNILTDGHGLEAADGAEKAEVEIVDDSKILVSVGSDKYIMPARMKASDAADEPESGAES